MNLERYFPNHTTDQAVAAMKHYAVSQYTDPKIQKLAQDITIGINPNDQVSQMLAILHWIMVELKYVSDEEESNRLFGTNGDLEMVKSPKAVLESGRYDCDCGSTLIAALLMSLGIRARFVTVGFASYEETGPDGFEHVYAQGWDEKSRQWIIVDPVSYPNEQQMSLDTKQVKFYDIA